MSSMQWRKADGSTGMYEGPLLDLGKGIPRPMGAHGFRRALFDLAVGYASGFPVRDIIPFAIRSLWPSPMLEVVIEEQQPGPAVIGTVYIGCPECGEPMPATVSVEVVDPDDDGLHAELVCTPDMTDIHAHVWSHRETDAANSAD